MFGYIGFVVLTGLIVILMLTGPRRPRALANIAYLTAPAYNELPFVFLLLTLVSVLPEYLGRDYLGAEPMLLRDWFGLAATALLVVGFTVIAWRGQRARPAVRRALDEALGEGWSEVVAPRVVRKLRGGPRWAHVLLNPVVTSRSSVERIPNLAYGPAGRAQTLDLYRPKHLAGRGDAGEDATGAAAGRGAPVLIYLHSGGFFSGSKRLGSAELLRRLASHGWVTISANYRLRPRAGFFEHLSDAKRVIAWAREQGPRYGADGETVVVAGGSAGAHLAAIAAQTQNVPRYQPGFEASDTRVSAVVGMYGWYGGYYELGGSRSEGGPLAYDAAQAPPFLLAHGELDTLAPLEWAEELADHLRSGSRNPVVFAALPGGHHGFDLFYSLRYEAVVDAVEAFACWVVARRDVEQRGLEQRGPEQRGVEQQGLEQRGLEQQALEQQRVEQRGVEPRGSRRRVVPAERRREPVGAR